MYSLFTGDYVDSSCVLYANHLRPRPYLLYYISYFDSVFLVFLTVYTKVGISPFIRAHRSVGVLSQYIINTRTHPGLRAMQPVFSICITCIKELCRYIWVWRIITRNELNLKLYKGVYNLLNPIS